MSAPAERPAWAHREAGEWVPVKSWQGKARVPVRVPGAVVQVLRVVYRGTAMRAGVVKRCAHNHRKRGPADTCGRHLPRELNREEQDNGN